MTAGKITVGVTSGSYLERYGLEAGAEKMKEHGIDCVDYQDLSPTDRGVFLLPEAKFEKELTHAGDVLRKNGIAVSQTHGPWRYPPADDTEELRAERFDAMAKAVRGTAYLGCRYMAIHPLMPFGASDVGRDRSFVWDINIEHFSKLCRVGTEYGVTICLENMPFTGQDLAPVGRTLDLIHALNSPNAGMCLDTGHCAVFGHSVGDAVRRIGKKDLKILHVHDNDGKNDLHWLPWTGVTDWDGFGSALREIGFEGCVSLETWFPGEHSEEDEKKLIANVKRIVTH